MFETEAKRQALPVLIALVGESSSGKTYSALLLAKGLVGHKEGAKIGMIDTEKGRGSMYANEPDMPKYFAEELHAPFSADRYVEMLHKARDADVDCLIIDSATHEWSGIGGCLDQVDKTVAQGGEKMKAIAWAKAKPRHQRFVDTLTQMPFHIIVCLRGAHKLERRVEGGKTEMAMSEDVKPVQQKDFIFDMTFWGIIDPDHVCTWQKAPGAIIDKLPPAMITAADGVTIAEWVEGGDDLDKRFRMHLGEMRSLANLKGRSALQAYYKKHVQPEPQSIRDAIKARSDELNSIAETAEKQRSEAEANKATETGGDPFLDGELPPKQLDAPDKDKIDGLFGVEAGSSSLDDAQPKGGDNAPQASEKPEENKQAPKTKTGDIDTDEAVAEFRKNMMAVTAAADLDKLLSEQKLLLEVLQKVRPDDHKRLQFDIGLKRKMFS